MNVFQPIAIVGVGALFPGSMDAGQFWRNIAMGKDLISDVPPDHWLIEDYYDSDPKAIDKTYGKRGAFLSDVDFDPVEFGVPPNIIPALDTAQLLALIVAKQVLTDVAGIKFDQIDLSRTGVILGSAALEALQFTSGRMQRPVWVRALREAGLPEKQVQLICDRISNSFTGWQENTFPGLLANVVSGRIANRFNFGASNCTVDAACASSLAALSMAVNELQLNNADMMITGGVDALNDIIMYMCFSKVGALSPSGDCRPFSDKADGTLLAEGLGMFALKRLSDAEKQGDKIYAVIRGIGSSSDGKSKSIYAPLAKGQSRAILKSYKTAGFTSDSVELVEAHGTGTRAGDIAEITGLKLAFAENAVSRKNFCALGSIKSQIGHAKSAAGAAGLFKAVMALHHKTFPPTIKIDRPDPKLELDDSPFYLNTKLRPWIKAAGQARRAGVSSFGFGGTNFHIALEEYTGPNKADNLRGVFPTELIILAAENPSTLIKTAETLLPNENSDLTALARTTQENYDPSQLARLCIIASDLQDFQIKLKQAITLIKQNSAGKPIQEKDIYYAYAANAGRVAFVFPGQGSQYVNMGADISMGFPAAMSQWEKMAGFKLSAAELLSAIIFPKPVFDDKARQSQENLLTRTTWAQPALAATSLLYWRLLLDLHLYPDAVAGHSFGEITALFAAGAFDENTLLQIAAKRGELLQQAADTVPGGMTSVMYAADNLLPLLKNAGINIACANFNSPTQVVLSGPIAELEQAEKYLTEQKIQWRRLPVATGFHSKLMQPASAAFNQFLKGIKLSAPKIPVYANITAALYPENASIIAENLTTQLTSPVRFQETVEQLYQNGVRTFIEVGPGSVLTNLIKQCLGNREFSSIPLEVKGENGISSFWRGLSRLFMNGLNPNFSALWKNYAKTIAVSETKKTHTIKINGTNYGRPYPPAGGAKDLPKPNPETKPEPKVRDTVVAMTPAAAPPPPTTVKTISANPTYRGNTMLQPTNNPNIIQMFQELQKQLVETQNTYQKMMAETHLAFLKSMSQLAGQVSGNTLMPEFIAPTITAAAPAPAPAPAQSNVSQLKPVFNAAPAVMATAAQPASVMNRAPAPSVAPMLQPAMQQAPAPVFQAAPATMQSPAPSPVQSINVAPAPVQITPPPPVLAPAAEPLNNTPVSNPATAKTSGGNSNVKDIILDIVVEKTGYPREMLNMDMAIESDLGIDSIKRVEIFSALMEKIPQLPQIDSNRLTEFQTLGHVLAYAEQNMTAK